jgi:16S rRNA (guanine966-N2)-methyltransferase
VADRIAGARFLDLFAGSGIFSFEALSRGAASATAVDFSRKNLEAITRLANLFAVQVEVVLGDAMRVRPAGPFDLVYADPPYDFGQYDELLSAIDRLELSAGAVVAVEHRRHSSPFTVARRKLALWRRAEYGEIWMTFFKASGLQ